MQWAVTAGHTCACHFPRSVAAVRMADGLTFVIYEFWETEEEWKRLVQPCPYPVPVGGADCL